MSTAIQPVWALHETSNGVLAVAKGILTAATSDNVQPLALLACEAFGATLAICHQTQLLVEKEARKHHTSYVVKFLKSKIGYSAHDSAVQLSATNAGVRFLSLAATLLCTSSNFTGAEALMLMIKSSSQKDQILPTLLQLQDLLDALDYKLLRTRFADDIIGWETFLSEYPECPPHIRQGARLSQLHPAVDELEKLVAAFRIIERVGEGDTASIRITATMTCPWLITFTKWCLGVPPTIVTANGAAILSQPKSKVILVIEARFKMDVTIEIFRDIASPAELWSGGQTSHTPSRWCGMVSISQFGKRRLGEVAFIDSSGHQALIQALSYTPKLVTSRFKIECPGDKEMRWSDHVNPEFAADLWPSDTKIASTITEFLNLASPLRRLGALKESETIIGLPLVKTYIKDVQDSCRCRNCSGDISRSDMCSITAFKGLVVDLTRDILTLSLFDTIEPILVSIPSLSRRIPSNDGFRHAIHNIILKSTAGTCEISSIFDAALSLIGHPISADVNINAATEGLSTWITSARRGQVVYPLFFDSMNLRNQALLSLGGGPGGLQHQGLKYELVVWKLLGLAPTVKIWDDVAVSGPQNLVDGEHLEWQVKVSNRCLELACGTTSSVKKFNPMDMLVAAAKSLFIPNCVHKEDSLLEVSDPNCYYITPCFHKIAFTNDHFLQHGDLMDSHTKIVAVAGNDGLRCFALMSGLPAVIRQSACLKCSIDLCRRTGFYYVVA